VVPLEMRERLALEAGGFVYPTGADDAGTRLPCGPPFRAVRRVARLRRLIVRGGGFDFAGRRGGGRGCGLRCRRARLARDMTGQHLVGQCGRGSLVELGGELLHPAPGHEQRRGDDEQDGGAKEDLALGRERDFQPSNSPEHLPPGALPRF